MDLRTAMRITAELPGVAGQFSGRLLIVGGARCVWDDIDQLPGRLEKWTGDIMAVNDVGQHIHQFIRHWATLHPEYMPGWHAYRYGHNYGARGHVYTHSTKIAAAIQFVWDLPLAGGSSGLFAAKIALLMGYEEIVLAGMPMDGSGHFFDPPWLDHSGLGRADLIEWEQAREVVFGGRVRSLSGKTREILGGPHE